MLPKEERLVSAKETPDVMTATDAADYLKVHIKTLYDWIRAGELRVIRLGPRSMRILKEDLRRFLETKATTGAEAVRQTNAGSSEQETSVAPENTAAAGRFPQPKDMKSRVAKNRMR